MGSSFVIDLHCHSTASDGLLPPDQLVTHFAARGVTAMALTDHDVLSGLAVAREAARDHGVAFFPGVEISVTWENRTIHVVGLNIDPHNAELVAGLQSLQVARWQRADAIVAKLTKLGCEGIEQFVAEQDPATPITRTHFARFLVSTGKARDVAQAFKKYLSKGKSAYVAANWASLENAVRWINQAGGCAVIAHPDRYRFSRLKLGCLADEFKQLGGVAMEIVYGGISPQDVQANLRIAQKYELLGSLGSDFHDPALVWTQPGAHLRLPPGITPVWQHGHLASTLAKH